ncbi:tetratricopeptide repeat protein [Ekhidna sp. To15]|uniref:tetratricopeptide repeat protein n=1 Tax=Ekhidna sp. To15 TaxID=3395267 RepID=UPI003F51DC31
MRKFLFLLIIGLSSHQNIAQQNKIDSLQTVLSELEVSDTAYVEVANDIAFRLSMSDQQQSIYYINLAISVSKDLNYDRGIIRATTIKGNSFLIIGMPDQALSHYLEALQYDPQRFPLEYIRINNNIGEVYRRKQVYDSSLKYFNRALSLAIEKIKDYQPVIIYSNLGEVSLMQGDMVRAEEYFNKCLSNAIESNHMRGQGYGYYGLAECAFLRGDSQKAINLMRNSIRIRLIADHKRGAIQSYLKMGHYFNSDKPAIPDSVLYYWNKTKELAKENEANDLLNEAYDDLYSFYLNRSDIENAAIYLELHKNLSDSIRNAEFISNVSKIRSALQSELINAENELLKQESLQHKAQDDARLIVISLAFLIVLGLALATYQYRMRQKASKEAENESRFNETLLQLSQALNENDFSLKEFVKSLLQLSRKTIESDRVTYWVYKPDDSSLFLNAVDQVKDAPQGQTAVFKREEFNEFFNEFMRNRTLAISRISQDERLKKIYQRYFKPMGIESILNAPVLIDGKFMGFISYTMIDGKVREWSTNEQRYVASLSDLIVVAIAKQRGNILEVEKEELIKKLQSRNKSLQEFNSVISHNLREPLTQIIGLSDLLNDDEKESNGESKEMISRIVDSSNKVDKVIKELSIILNENDPKPSDFRILSLGRLVKDVVDSLKTEIKSHDVTIEQNLELDKVKSYRPYLTDALYHLISNSIKFLDPDKRLHIKIRSYEDELKQYIVISDNGRGMDLSRVGDKIFKMYQRFHMDVEGRGLGLFIVKNRINVLNGLIKVESEEGIGSAFTIEFTKYTQSLN